MKQEQHENQKIQEPIRKSRSRRLTLVKKVGDVPSNAIYGKVCSIVGNQVVVKALDAASSIITNNIINTNTNIRTNISTNTNTSSIITNNINNGATTNKNIYECVPAGTIISKNNNLSNLIATGDNVWFLPSENTLGSIIKVDERQNFFSRQDPANRKKEQILAANIDNVIVFFSIIEPLLNIKLIDRFLIAATLGGVTPAICINKIDLVEASVYEDILDIYQKNNIDIFVLSAINKTGLEEIKKFILGKENLVTGPSGTGKSTFLNAILGYEAQAVREISDRTSKGTHTTSFSRRYIIDVEDSSIETAIIDTPGLREFGIWDLTKAELPLFFYDFLPFIGNCHFASCSHTHEPDCAVKLAVESEEILFDRYESYLNIYDTLI